MHIFNISTNRQEQEHIVFQHFRFMHILSISTNRQEQEHVVFQHFSKEQQQTISLRLKPLVRISLFKK
jgi:hypothetical protein